MGLVELASIVLSLVHGVNPSTDAPTRPRPGPAPRPGDAGPGPRLPGMAGKPDEIICCVRPRQGGRKRRAVLAAVLAGTVWAGLLIWRASPVAPGMPGRAEARHPGAVISFARARQQRRRQRAAQAAVDAITAAVGGGAAAGLHFRGRPPAPQPPHPRPGPPGHGGPKALTGINVLGSACHGDVTGIVPKGRDAWVMCSDGTMLELNAATGTPVRALDGLRSLSTPPFMVHAIAAVGDRIWVADYGGDSVTELSASTGALIRVLRGPRYQFNHPAAITIDGDRIWVGSTCPNGGGGWMGSVCFNSGNPVTGLTELKAATGAPVRVLNGSRYGFAGPIAVAPDGRLWVTNFDGDSVTVLNAATGAPAVNGATYGFSLPRGTVSDGTYAWVANTGDNSVTELSATTGALIRALRGPRYRFNDPGAIAADGHRIWVANSGGNSVTEFPASAQAQ